jgi:hypothetical protein
MKKSLMVLAASAVILFAACNKEENNGYTINGDQITFGVGSGIPQDEGKQSFSGRFKRVYFTTGDQMYVNGVAYPVRPQQSANATGSTGNFSPFAKVTVTASSTGSYDFVYPVNTMNPGTNGYTATYPAGVQALNGNALNNDLNAPTRSARYFAQPIWPMYANLASIDDFNGQIMMLNTCSFISPEVVYGPGWANEVFSELTGETYGDGTPCPVLNFNDGRIRSNIQLNGPAHLDVSDPTWPVMVMDAPDASYEANPYEIYFAAHEGAVVTDGTEAVGETQNIAGIIPIAPIENRSAKQFRMFLGLNTTINGTTYYLLFRSNTATRTGSMERNLRYFLSVNMQTIGSTASAQAIKAPNYASDVVTNYSYIDFPNGRLFVTTNSGLLTSIREANWVNEGL